MSENIMFDYTYNDQKTVDGYVVLTEAQTESRKYYAVNGFDGYFGCVFQTENGWTPYYGSDERKEKKLEQRSFGDSVNTLEEAVGALLLEGNGAKVVGNPYMLVTTKVELPNL
jgi:hypothetical protein